VQREHTSSWGQATIERGEELRERPERAKKKKKGEENLQETGENRKARHQYGGIRNQRGNKEKKA